MTTKETPTESVGKPSIPVVTIAAATFFTAVISLTGYFFYTNTSLETAIASEKKRAAEYETSIAALKRDSAVQAAEVLSKAKPEIIKNIESSVASNYVRELDRIHKEYLVQFNGFAYLAGRVTTSIVAEKWLSDDAIRKVIKLIGDQRGGSSTGSLTLSPVSGVNGDSDKRTLGVEFKTR